MSDKPELSRLALSLGIGSQLPKESRPVADVLGKLKKDDKEKQNRSDKQ
jgi:hypothetical protein